MHLACLPTWAEAARRAPASSVLVPGAGKPLWDGWVFMCVGLQVTAHHAQDGSGPPSIDILRQVSLDMKVHATIVVATIVTTD